jgi:signal transduction histidine kinase
MKRSSRKIFIVVIAVFLAVLLVQQFLSGRFYEDLYLRNIIASQQDELDTAAMSYLGGDASSVSVAISDYTTKTDAPVLVITEDHRIGDRRFFSYFNILGAALVGSGGVKIRVLSDDLEVNGPDDQVSELGLKRRVHIRALQLGDSDLYEPLIVSVSVTTYTNRASVRRYKTDATVGEFNDYAHIDSVSHTLPSETKLLAAVLYGQVKDCLIRRSPVGEYLEELTGRTISEGGSDYRIYSAERTILGERYYLVSIRPVTFSGLDRSFMNRFFLILYALLAVLLIAAAWWLSRYVSQISELEVTTEKAKADEKRMKALLNDLAHEFKTPLFVISSYTEALEAGLPGEDRTKYYSIIDGEINKLSDMVSEVIELSNLESGRWQVEIGEGDLREVVSSTVEKFEKRFTEGGYDVSVDVPDAAVLMDPRRIEQVISNFLSNAIKYSGPKKKIEIFTEQKEPGRIFVYVGNSGEVSEEDRERIWDRYYGSGNAQNTRLPSAGIGLDIVRNILQAHGSEHGVVQRGDMLCFYFSLKLAGERES